MRVVVFVDEENVYKGARRVFNKQSAPIEFGRVSPMDYAKLLVKRSPYNAIYKRSLEQVRVYTGRPSQERDHEGYAVHRRRVASWEKSGCLVHARPLRYRKNRPPEQKGVDVKLALDAVRMMILGQLDIAILATTDTDLVPVLETFHDLCPKDATTDFLPVEVVAWKGTQNYPSRINLKIDRVWCHMLTVTDYESVADSTDYSG